ncbi:hypothetical protein PENSPDRAFT_757585 [Peniophora sp. CONT]|nr:hypothetical protein PENSPDRAFT_757585 [Peniophora sp. CONT]
MASGSTSNSTLSDSDIATLNSIGNDTIQSIVALVVESILYTTYFVLVVMCGRILLKRNGRSKFSIAIFAVVVTMLLLDTATSIIDVNNAIREITFTLTSTSSDTLADRYDNMVLPWPVQNALYAFMMNLGDVVIIWRTYAFWSQPRERWVLLIPMALLLGSFTTSCLISYCVAKLDADPELGDFLNPPFCVNIQLAAYSMTLATTAVATAMICWKTWVYRRTISSSFRSTNKKTRAEKIMAIMIESGVLFFLFILSAVVDDAGNVPNLETSTPQLVFASTIWTYMTSHILGMYPVIVVILVHSRKSYIEGATNSAGSGTVYSQSPRVHSESRSAPSSRSDWGTGSVGSRVKHAFIKPGRGHVLDINVTELRQVHREQSLTNVGAESMDVDIQSQVQQDDTKTTPAVSLADA